MWSELQALKVGWLAQSKKLCHGETLINQCSSFDYPSNFEGLLLTLRVRLFQMVFCFVFLRSYIFIYDQNVNAKSNRNRNCIFFILLGNPKDRTLDYLLYASHIRHNFPNKLIAISMSYLKYF